MRRGWMGPLLLGVAVAIGCGGSEAIQIGAVLPLSGSAAIYGQAIQKGLQLALEEIRASHPPRPIELTVVDSASSPAQAKTKLAELYGQGAWAVIGGVTTIEAKEMVSTADEFDRVLLSPSASSPELTGISRNFYRTFPSDFHEGTKMGNFARQTLELDTAVILAAQGPYAVGIQQVFRSEFERHGGQVLETLEFPEGTSEFSGFLERVMTLKPDAVYLAAFAREIAGMIRGLRRLTYQGTILTTSALATSQGIADVGTAGTGVFLTQSAFEPRSEEPLVQNFVKAYTAKYGGEPDIYGANGYDALRVIAAGLQMDVAFPADLWKGLRALRNVSGVTGPIQFDERGDVQKFPRVYVIDRNGDLLNYEGEVEKRRREIMDRLRELQQERRRTGGEGGA